MRELVKYIQCGAELSWRQLCCTAEKTRGELAAEGEIHLHGSFLCFLHVRRATRTELRQFNPCIQSLEMGVQDKSCRACTGHAVICALRIALPLPYYSKVESTKQ
jgi:hypothetical protein